MTLDGLLADAREEAAILRKHGDARMAESLERLADQVATLTEEYRRFLSEDEAMNWSGHRRPWFRGRFPQWESEGHAYRQNGKRYYRALVVPRRVNLEAVRYRAREDARGAA